jgi:hypothetical protein
LIWTVGVGGTGRGTPYGVGAATAVAFLPLFLVRLYYPGPPLTKIIFTVSVVVSSLTRYLFVNSNLELILGPPFFLSLKLVVGYGWQNAHYLQLTNATWGWDVAWRRFLMVLIGKYLCSVNCLNSFLFNCKYGR